MSKIAEVLERLERVEAAVAGIGHNGGPPLDDDEPLPPKRRPGLLADRLVAERARDLPRAQRGRFSKHRDKET